MSKPALEWSTHEHVYTEKSSDWFWAVGIITISLAVTAIIFNNVLFALIILIGSFSLTMHAMSEPPLREYALTEKGAMIDHVFYPYEHLDSYWVDEVYHPSKVLIKSKKVFMPYIVMPLSEHVDPDEVRGFLDDHLRSVEHRESIFHKALEHLGF